MQKDIISKNNFYRHDDFLKRRNKIRWSYFLLGLFFLLEYIFLFKGLQLAHFSVFAMFGAFIIATVLHFFWFANLSVLQADTIGKRLLGLLFEALKLGIVLGAIIYLTFIAVDHIPK